MTRPTTDGDTKARTVTHDNGSRGRITHLLQPVGLCHSCDLTRLSEQEVELERLREKAQAVLDACWGSFPVGTGAVVSDLEAALTPTTEDREGSAPG